MHAYEFAQSEGVLNIALGRSMLFCGGALAVARDPGTGDTVRVLPSGAPTALRPAFCPVDTRVLYSGPI